MRRDRESSRVQSRITEELKAGREGEEGRGDASPLLTRTLHQERA